MRIFERFDDCVVVETSKQFQIWFRNEQGGTILVGLDVDYDTRPVVSFLGLVQRDLKEVPQGVEAFGFDKAIFSRLYDGVLRPALAMDLERVDTQGAQECVREYFRGGPREYDYALHILYERHLRVLHLFRQLDDEIFAWFISFCKLTQQKREPLLALVPLRWGHETLNALFTLVGKAGKGLDLIQELITKHRQSLDREFDDGIEALIEWVSVAGGDEKQVLTQVSRLQMVKQLCGSEGKGKVFVTSREEDPRSTAIASLQEAVKCIHSGNPKAAITPLNRALQEGKSDEALASNAKALLALCYKQLGELDKAEQCYLSAFEFLSRSTGSRIQLPLAELMQNLSNLYLEKKEFVKVEEWGLKAKQAFQQLGKINKAAEIDMFNLSEVYYGRGDLKGEFVARVEAFEILKNEAAYAAQLDAMRENTKRAAKELLRRLVAERWDKIKANQPVTDEQAELIKRCQEVLDEP